MTNTLTWDIKPIQVPKLNANLLSAISFLMLCLMLFTAGAAIVEAVCESEYSALQWAEFYHGTAYSGLVAAEAALVLAIISMNPIAIAGAILAVGTALGAVAATGADLIQKQKAYEDCLNRPTAGGDSGSCSG